MEWQNESEINKEKNSPRAFPPLAMYIVCDFECKIIIRNLTEKSSSVNFMKRKTAKC